MFIKKTMSDEQNPKKTNQTKSTTRKKKVSKKTVDNDNSAPSKKRKISNLDEPSTSGTNTKKKKSNTKNASSTPQKTPKKKSKDDKESDLDEWGEDTQDLNNSLSGKFGLVKEENKDNLKLDASYWNFQRIVLEEICLEGLDGITLEALWTRLAVLLQVTDQFSNSIKHFFWNVIKTKNDIEFYKLQEERPQLQIFDRYKDGDPDLGLVIDPIAAPPDIYPFHPVKDIILGSASSFLTRSNISSEVRSLTLEAAELKYGSKLVIVASDRIRRKTIVHPLTDPNIEFNSIQYCLLERIGRSRYHGEVTQGKVSLQVISKDLKVLFYNRKILSENNLIMKQPFNIKTSSGSHMNGTLIHLHRFYKEQKTKTYTMTYQMVEALRQKQGYCMEYEEAKRLFGHVPVLRKLFKLPEFQRFVKTDVPRYSKELYPDDPSKWKTQSSDKEKVVRTLELINPTVNIPGVWYDDEAKEESSDEETTQEIMYNIPILHQIYDFIKLGGHEGRSIKDILLNKGLDFYSTRAAVNQLVNLKVIAGIKIDVGRQRLMKYRAIHCLPINLESRNLESQHEKEQLEVESIAFLSDLLEVEPTYLISTPIHENSEIIIPDDNYALIKKLRQQNRQKKENTECNAILMATFRNEHGYINEENNYTSPSVITLPKSICDGIRESWNAAQNHNPQTKIKLTKFLQKLKRQNADAEVNHRHALINIDCPITTFMCDETYARILKNVIKLSQFLLSSLKYKITQLSPRKQYMCKQPVPLKKLQDFSQDHPLLIESSAAIPDLKRKKAILDHGIKRIRADEDEEVRVTKDIYMGPHPVLAYQSVDSDGIDVAVWVSTKPEEFNDFDLRYVRDNNATVRTLKRAHWILDAVHQELVITDIHRLHKAIQAQDQEEGYNVKADRKSFQRIYTRLVRSGHIKILQIVLKFKKLRRMVTVLCDPSLDVHHSIIESVIEQFKMKFFIPKKKEPLILAPQPSTSSGGSAFETLDVSSSVGELKQLGDEDSPYLYNRNIGKDYGYVPKFMRMRALHELLFHIIYNYPFGQELKDVADMFKELNVPLSENEIEEMPPIYCREISWKMFIPPLPSHSGWPEGWALVCDVLLRLPLSIFVKLCNVCLVIPDLPLYLEHPVKQYYLVQHLPSSIRRGLLHRRKYIFTIHETLSRLCFIGLVQFGPQKLREKDQVFMYLNRNATLLDTTTSNAGYHYIEQKEYAKKQFHFVTPTDVETYWYEMWNICAHTKLGLRNTVIGTYITIEHLETKAAMVEALRAQTPDTVIVNDNGFVPGDQRGAAGIDSALWSHIKRNWIWSLRSRCNPPVAHKRKQIKSKKRLVERSQSKFSENTVINCARKSKNKFFIRKVAVRAERKRERGYDMVDRKLMENLKQSRSEWTCEEDRALNICKIVATFLCPNFRKQNIQYTVIRDTLHHLVPCSTNKTSGACQRRIGVLFGTTDQQEYLQQIVKTLTCIPFVKKYFQKFYDHVQSGQTLMEMQLRGAFVFLVMYFYKHQNKLQHIFEAINLKYQYEVKPLKSKTAIAQETEDIFAPRRYNSDSHAQLEVLAYDSVEFASRSNKTARLYPDSSTFPKTETDIILDTIKAIIHSTVAGRPDDISCIYQIFRVYQNYADELLKNAVNEVRNSQMVTTAKKIHSKKHIDVKVIPISTKLFQFSFYYNFIYITKFPVELFSEAHEMFLGVQKHRENLSAPTTNGLPMECVMQGQCIGLSEIATKVNAHFVVDFPKEVLILNPSIADHTELIRELAIRYKKMLTLLKDGTYFKDDPQVEAVEKVFSRVPMIQRFLKSWFLSEDDEEFEEETENFSNKMDVAPDKKHRRGVPMTTQQGQKILQSLNKEILQPNILSSSKSRELLKSTNQEDIESFEDYEKKLENLLSSKITEEEDENVTGKGENVQSENESNLFEKYLPIRIDPPVNSAIVDNHETVDATELDVETNTQMEYLMDDELSVEQIMNEMLADCPAEERKVPKPINLSRLLVKGLFPELDEDEERLERLHRHFLIVCPDTNLMVSNFEDDDELSYLYLDHPLVCKNLLRKVQMDIIVNDPLPSNNDILTKFKSLGCTELDTFVVDSLIDFIAKKHAVGASAKDVKKHFSNLDNAKLSSLLNTLIEMNVILRTGIIYTVFVHHKYRKHWLVESCTLEYQDKIKLKESKEEKTTDVDLPTLAKSLDSYTEIKLNIKPWARIDGTLNLKTFEKWLCTMLGYCLAEEMVALKSIINQCCYLKPVDIFYLLECLQDLGCIKMIVCKAEKCSLFSEIAYVNDVPASIMDEFEDIYIENDKLAIIKFGALLNKKLKEFDFPTDPAKKHGTF